MIKAAIIGYGFIGQLHSNVFKALQDVELVAISDVDSEKRKKAKKDGFPVKSVNAIINDSQIDVISICLPTYLHKKFTVKALNAGKDVFCEKPMARNSREAQEMIDTAKKNNKILVIGHCIRFWSEFQILADYIRSEKAGKLKSLKLVRLSGRPVWSWNNWLMNEKLSGGAALDLHIHDTDFIFYLFGKPDSVKSIGNVDYSGISHIWTIYNYNDKDVRIIAEGGWDYPTKSYYFHQDFEAVFEKGALYYHLVENKLYFCPMEGEREEVTVEDLQPGDVETIGNISALGAYYKEVRYFIDCVKNKKAPEIIKPENALLSLKIIEAECKSVRKKKEIKVK